MLQLDSTTRLPLRRTNEGGVIVKHRKNAKFVLKIWPELVQDAHTLQILSENAADRHDWTLPFEFSARNKCNWHCATLCNVVSRRHGHSGEGTENKLSLVFMAGPARFVHDTFVREGALNANNMRPIANIISFCVFLLQKKTAHTKKKKHVRCASRCVRDDSERRLQSITPRPILHMTKPSIMTTCTHF